MKVSYNNTDKLNANNSTEIIMEIGEYGVSIAWYNPQTNSIEGVKSYQFKNNNSSEIAGHLSEIFKEKFIQGKLTTLFIDFKEFMITPEKFYRFENNSEALNLLFGKKDSILKDEKIKALNNSNLEDAFNIYRVEKEIYSVINNFYPDSAIFHSSSKQIEIAENGLTLSIFNNIIKLLLKDDDGFKFIKHFNYKTPLDVVFVLLDVCKNYNVSPQNIQLNLKGMIDKESNLFKEIEKYFMNVSFELPHADVNFNFQNDEESNHYFSNLTHLIKCVS